MAEKDDDDLLRRARELNDRIGNAGRDSSKNHQSAYDQVIAENKLFRRLASASDTVNRYLGPIGSFLAWLVRLVARWLNWLCMQPADSDAPAGSKSSRFSLYRMIRNLVLSGVALLLIQVVLKGLYFYGTYFEETVYVTGKQEIVTGELYQFGGCTSLPCSTISDNGKFYLIESSLYFPIMFYPEENVFANVPQQDAACHVEGYGIYFRSLRWIYKSLQLYQHVVDVSCRPYTDLEIRKAVGDGEIVIDE